jgi:hypothetical protein
MAYGAELYNIYGDEVFSTEQKSLVYIATLSPRNYGTMDTNGMVDFEIPNGIPDDIEVIPFISYTGSLSNGVVPIISGVIRPKYYATALVKTSSGQNFLNFTQQKIKYASNRLFGISRGVSAASATTLTISFDATWTSWGTPSSIIVNVPSSSGTYYVAKLVAEKINQLASDKVSAQAKYSIAAGTSPAAIIVNSLGVMGPVDLPAPVNPVFTWSSPPASGLQFFANVQNSISPFLIEYDNTNQLIIPQIGDVLRIGDATTYTVTGMSSSTATYSIPYVQWGPVVYTTSPALPSVSTNTFIRTTTLKSFIRVTTGNVPSENQKYKCYLFGRVQDAARIGYGMQMYNSNNELTFDSNQRALILAAKGVTVAAKLADSSTNIVGAVNVAEGEIPLNYAINYSYIGEGWTQYGSNPTGNLTTVRPTLIHLQRNNATQFNIRWSNTYKQGVNRTITGNASQNGAYLNGNQPFYVIDTTKYPSS